MEAPQPLKVSPGCRAGPGSRGQAGSWGRPTRAAAAGSYLPSSAEWLGPGLGPARCGVAHVWREGTSVDPYPLPLRKPLPGLLRAHGFGAIREPVTSQAGADGMVAGFPSPCPAPPGGRPRGPLCPPPGPAGAWCQPLSPGQPVTQRALCCLQQKGPVAPRPGVGAWEGAKQKPEPATPHPQPGWPSPGTAPWSSAPPGDPSQIRAGASPRGLQPLQGWVEDGRGGGNGGPGRPCAPSA